MPTSFAHNGKKKVANAPDSWGGTVPKIPHKLRLWQAMHCRHLEVYTNERLHWN